jgi:F-type H+-transporting ATPase subunit delta
VAVSDRSIARRYAAALFDVVGKTGRAEQAGTELSSITAMIDGHAELRRVLETPAIPAHVKKEIIGALLDAAGGFSGQVTRLVLMLAERDRLGSLSQVQLAYSDRLLDEKKIVPADIVTSVPLSEASRTALANALGSATGRQVTLKERVDPEIVGGVIARVGSLVFDGSVTRQLDRLRQNLATSS